MKNYKYAIMHTGPRGTQYLIYGRKYCYGPEQSYFYGNRKNLNECLSNNKTHRFLFDSKAEARNMLKSIIIEGAYKIAPIRLSKKQLELAGENEEVSTLDPLPERKYELTGKSITLHRRDGTKGELFQIRALKDIVSPVYVTIGKGAIGGYIEDESNLSQDGGCWIYSDAAVFGHSKISENARICTGARIINSTIDGDVIIQATNLVEIRDSEIHGTAKVYCGTSYVDTRIRINRSKISGNALIKSTGAVIEITKCNIGGDILISAGKFTDCTIGLIEV